MVEAGDKVLMEFSTFGDRFLSIVTDVRDDGRLFVFSPISDLVLQRFKTDASARVRFAQEGRLRGFGTRVLNAPATLGTVLELAAPVEYYDAEDRCEPRCPCRFPAVVEDGGHTVQAVVEDMSFTCSRVRFLNGGLDPKTDAIGREVCLKFHPFDMQEGYTVDCMVHSTFVRDNHPCAVLSFKPEQEEASQRIKQFIEAQLYCGIPRL